MDPAPQLAAGVETRLGELGTQLFQGIFQATDDARDLWAVLRPQLAQTRVEVASDVTRATVLPWELLRDPTTAVAVALRAAAFVRTHHQPAQPAQLPAPPTGERLRVLLVICRSAGGPMCRFAQWPAS